MEARIPVTLLLLFVALSSVGALEVTIPERVYEKARGDNISLPCSFKTKGSPETLTIVSWSVEGIKAGAKETLILTHYHPSKRTDVNSQYEGRASVDINVPKGKADLLLKSITLEDNKEFECRIQIPGDDEGKPAATTRLVVLVAPSPPICEIQGKAEYGQNINLTCHSKEGSPPPEYTWDSRDARNMPRTGALGAPRKGAVLSLFNISKETSGYFTCTSANKIRSAKCNITLSVMPPSMNWGTVGWVVAVIVAALIILGVIVYFCCCRKKEEKQDYAMGVREVEYHDKEPDANGESRHPDRKDLEDARGPDDRRDRYEERSERDYDDRRERDYDDRRSDYDDRRRDYDDRRSDYDDRRSDYNDRRSDYDDRRSDYDDRRDRHGDRRDRYDDDDRRYDDRREYTDDRYDEPYDGKPEVPANKPRRDYDD